MDFLNDVLDEKTDILSEFNIISTIKTCEFLEIPIHYEVYSEMKLDINDIKSPDEWALQITKITGYDTYVNPIGGMSFFDRDKYKSNGVELEFLQQELIPYIQKIGHFEAGLSIIDVMMICDVKTINKMMEHYTILN